MASLLDLFFKDSEPRKYKSAAAQEFFAGKEGMRKERAKEALKAFNRLAGLLLRQRRDESAHQGSEASHVEFLRGFDYFRFGVHRVLSGDGRGCIMTSDCRLVVGVAVHLINHRKG